MIAKKQIIYPGITNPTTPLEVKVEIFGLKNAIKIAEELISRLEQALAIVELTQENLKNEPRKSEGE